jgi:chemotaxis protein CheC
VGIHSAKETDFYAEVASIGGGHAATALSDMLQSRVHMEVPEADEMPLAAISSLVAPGITAPELVKISVVGELDGTLCVIFEEPAHYVTALGCEGEMLHSAFAEISNILCARFLIAINQILEINTEVSPPEGKTVGRDELITELKELAENADPFVTLRAGLSMEGIESNASILYFPTQSGLDQLKKSL